MNDVSHLSLLGQDLTEDEDRGAQFLTFVLNQEQYGLSILRVQEIRGWEPVTRIPNSPGYVRGVVNLRGNIVPVFDLRLRFGLESSEYTQETVVIVVRAGKDQHKRSIGLVVDAVSDVIVVREEQINATPQFGAGVPTQNISGLVRDDDKMVMLLDLDSLAIEDNSAQESEVH